MAIIIRTILIFILLSGCGKKGNIIRENYNEKDKPAVIDQERVYQL